MKYFAKLLKQTAFGGGLLAAMFGTVQGAFAQQSFPFNNPSLPISQRVNDLVSRMTLQEKVLQMQTDAPAIPRLGIPYYGWWSESLHGFASGSNHGGDTVFPEPMGLASTFDLPLESHIATIIGDEDRAEYNLAGLVGKPQAFHGLTFFAPNINIFRDPRWGRGQETYGEDPYLTSRFGVTFVKGLQGNDPKYIKVVATPKHFAVHSGPEPERHRFDAVVSDYDLHDTYLPAFEAAIREGHAQSIMGAYSSLDGVPDCASPLLLQTNLRQAWGFDGYVVSDCGAIGDIFNGHHYAKSMAEAAADAVKAGCDITCGGEYASLPDAVKQGLITEAQIDVSVKRLFKARMQLGMFDPVADVPYNKISPDILDDAAHRAVALQAAEESLVLLKNQSNFLPLHGIKHIAVIGPNADDTGVLRGNYNGQSHHEVTALEGIKKRAAAAGVEVTYARGCGLTGLSDMGAVPSSALSAHRKPGLFGEYFSNPDLTGTPVATRQDDNIAFSWNGVGPMDGIKSTEFSIRWKGTLTAPVDGDYRIGVRGDDGFRLFLNGKNVIDDWTVHAPETRSISVNLKKGQAVPIRIEYFQAEQGAEVTLLWSQPHAEKYAEALDAAKNADVIVFVGGISSQLEGEEGTNGGGDRTDLDIPAVQQNMLEALAALHKPIVMVLMNGSALSVNWGDKNASAILESWYPGEEGGTAIADALFGDYNPAGRLPVTFYKSVNQLPPFRDYSMKDRTYRYFTGTPLYPFGFGLSYSRFKYSDIKVPAAVSAGDSATVTAKVKNIGKVGGDEVVELYVQPAPIGLAEISPGQPMPRLELAGFQRVHLQPGQSGTATFTLQPKQLRLFNARGVRTLQPVYWRVYVGGEQPDLTMHRDGTVSAGIAVK